MSGDRRDVNQHTVNDWKSELPSLYDGFESDDIFNTDKTELFKTLLAEIRFIRKEKMCWWQMVQKENYCFVVIQHVWVKN